MKTILGYSDRFSVAPGGVIAFKVSSENAVPFGLRIVRIIHGDINPAGPGYKEESVETAVNGVYPGRKQRIVSGSYATTAAHPVFATMRDFSVSALIWPTRPGLPGQVIMSQWDEARASGFYLSLESEAGLSLTMGGEVFSLCRKLLPCRWYRVTASFDAASGEVTLCQQALAPDPVHRDSGQAQFAVKAGFTAPGRGLIFAARDNGEAGCTGFYNGKLEAPHFSAGEITCAWDFAHDISGVTLHDDGPYAVHGTIHQLPARAVTGHNWDGTEFNWRRAPWQYAAIHFHDDDIYDAGWQDDAVWQVPEGIGSGLYAAHLSVAGDEDYIPFVITPPTGVAGAPILLVLPSASYLAYANEHLAFDADLAERVHDVVPIFGAADIFLSEHREFGGSLYDRHADGSGIYSSSRLRPILNMRPKYQSWLGGTGSALWQLNADTHIIGWLEASGFAYDVISDEDLHRRGDRILPRYRCVITGTHPEYVSTSMQRHIAAFQAEGGNLLYLGGNGFYWRIAFHATLPGVIEVRRAEVGNGWITPPGEAYHGFNGEYGGLWRRLGLAPQMVTGIGFVGQGFDVSSYYRRLPDSFDPRAAFIFEGIGADEPIGDFGLIGGGAAGLELDCVDAGLGTPAHALVLARSEGHTNNYLPTLETLLINHAGQGAEHNVAVHADMVFFETGRGGAVFSTGSIAWAGALSHAGYQNNVSRITANVLRRFVSPTGF